MKNSIKNLDTRKVIGTVIGGIVFVCCLLYFTYAFYNWRSTNTIVDLTIEDVSGGECAIGPDVNAVDIGPVLNIWDGVIAEFSVNNDAASVYKIALSLNINTIHEDLRVKSFKYALVQDVTGGTNYDYENPVLEDDFEGATDGQTLILADTDDATTDIPSLEIAGNSSYSFQFIVYIDGSMYNSNEMQSTTTETKGLYSSLMIGDCGSISDSSPVASYVISLYNDGSEIKTVNIADDISKPKVHLNEEQGIMLDNNGNYRYYGANPNNFVEYNDELWRIISVSNVKSSLEDAIGSMRLKLIRYESIGNYSFDGEDIQTSVNDWSKADLMRELNTLYYSNGDIDYAYGSGSSNFSSNVLSNEAMNMIDDAVWYLGGTTHNGPGYDGNSLYANDYYNLERGTNVWGASSDQTCNDGACPRATSWVGLVGLINPSDYAYSTDLSVCTVPGANYATGCVDTTWFSYSDHRSIWTLNPNSLNATTLFVVGGAGDIGNYRVNGYFTDTYMENAVYPVVYLKENVDIIDGYGTSKEPYIIELIEE